MVAGLVAGLAAGASAQTPPGYVRDGKVWFKVVEDGTRVDDFRWQAPPDGKDCLTFGTFSSPLGLRYDSFEKGTGGPGTFTLDTCSPGELAEVPTARDPWAVLQQVPGHLVHAPGYSVEIVRPLPIDAEIELILARLEESTRPEVFLGGTYRRFDRAPSATVSSETFTLLRNGQVVGQEQGDTTASELNELFDMTYEEESAGVEFRFAPKVGRTHVDLAASARRTRMLLRYGIVDLESGTEWAGHGNDLEGGLDVDVPLSGGFFVKAGGRYSVLLETEVTRSPGLSASGGQITEDRGDLKRTTGSVRAALGYEWGGRAAVWAGAEAAWDTVRLEGSAAAEFQQPSGLVEQRIEFTNEFESDGVRAFGGLELRVAGPVYVHADYVGSSAGSTFVVGLGAGRGRR
jgi:hypothetical protein